MLELWTLDGRHVASFLDRPRRLSGSAYVRLFSYVPSDACEGIIYGAVSFSNTLHAFDSQGVQVGQGLIDELDALPVLTDDVAPKNGEIPQGGPRTLVAPLEGWRYIARVVALPDRFVAMQVNQVDASSLGMLSGGTLIIAFLTEDGHIRNVHRLQTDAALIGRNAEGAALLARYADNSYENYEILRLDIAVVG